MVVEVTFGLGKPVSELGNISLKLTRGTYIALHEANEGVFETLYFIIR